jgi:hypothetical protein
VNQLHNQDHNRLNKYTSHAQSCSDNGITKSSQIVIQVWVSKLISENNIALK